ncbi:HTH-type transcriptional activator CmpR [Vibrio aerogenes CECT 7868]|uniref:HTH-type transcriptional activator CmpR n=1 Tax=Vibrio aerogenes CECT 7868 TaxID=1216006 RepID=A0A1M5ZPW3_9VIBR|nr:LysR family transcriptional regulator [Vibrio aerogenes]SHI26260.1 HTH-type transcriptional activator CmpR [Vibrio aerogenes CECT 7868]
MEIHQLKTFLAVAREGSITRASDQLCLSQPAVSAHIKAIEETLGLTLFDRTPQGMCLTSDGRMILPQVEMTLNAHREIFEQATRIKGQLSGNFRLGIGCQTAPEMLGELLTRLADRHPDITVSLTHSSSADVIQAVRNETLDAGFYSEAGESDPVFDTTEVERFGIYLTAAPGMVDLSQPADWQQLAALPWICPASSTCCGRAAEALFDKYQIRPAKMISVDREAVTKNLIAGGVGIGLLHTDTVRQAQLSGEIEVICEAHKAARVLFFTLKNRAGHPLLKAMNTLLCEMIAHH